MAVDLVPLAPAHVDAILAGQDALLAREVAGRWWDRQSLTAVATRAARWAPEGPLCELVAVEDGAVVGGGGIHRLGAGLERGQTDLSYWVLAAHRGRGRGLRVATLLRDRAAADPRNVELVLRIALGNTASAAVARRLGAVPTGRRERHPADARRTVERWTLPVPAAVLRRPTA